MLWSATGECGVQRLRPWLLILLGGVILPISFCGFDQWYLTWCAFVPLLLAIDGATRRQAAFRGFVYGVIANLIGYYWIPYTIYEFGGFPPTLAWAFGLVLCSYQGVQYLLLAYLTVRLQERKYSLLWVFPAIMVGLETIYPLLFPIFMGNTQHVVPILIQACDLLGPLLITAVILLFNVSLYIGIKAAMQRQRPWPWRAMAAGPAGLALLLIYGAVRMPMVESDIEAGTPLQVGIVQPSMGILEKWRDVEEGLRRHEEASLDLERRGAELIIWSEAAYTAGYILPNEPNLRRRFVPELTTPLLGSALTLHVEEDETGRHRIRHNSAIMLDAEGNVLDTYDKTYLLAFGEYLPFGDVFPELYEYSPNTGRLNPGTRIDALPFDFEGERWNIGALICYEDIIPGFTRALVRHASPDLLVNMTNDAWFGDTNEPWIHLNLAIFRAIEHRRYLVRATNTGVSAIVDPLGRVVEHTEVFETDTLLSTVRLLRGSSTLYAAVGDILGYIALGLLIFGLYRTRKVWLRAPEGPGRAGIRQAAGVLLTIGIFDVLSLAFVIALVPAGWTPSLLVVFVWGISGFAMIAGFVYMKRRSKMGLTQAWIGTGARIVLAIILLVSTSEARLATTSALIGVPLAFAIAAAVTLWMWRERVDVIEKKETAEKPEKTADRKGSKKKKKKD